MATKVLLCLFATILTCQALPLQSMSYGVSCPCPTPATICDGSPYPGVPLQYPAMTCDPSGYGYPYNYQYGLPSGAVLDPNYLNRGCCASMPYSVGGATVCETVPYGANMQYGSNLPYGANMAYGANLQYGAGMPCVLNQPSTVCEPVGYGPGMVCESVPMQGTVCETVSSYLPQSVSGYVNSLNPYRMSSAMNQLPCLNPVGSYF